MKISLLILLIFIIILNRAHSQDKITVSDSVEINSQAKEVLRGLAQLLSLIATPKKAGTKLSGAITSSYTPSDRNRVFYSNKSTIQSDVDPASQLSNAKEVQVEKYLNDFDVKYAKSPDSIIFSGYKISEIKNKKYLYVRVEFTSKFPGKYNINRSRYPPKQREALIRVERGEGEEWTAFISDIGFYDPENPIESDENNVTIVPDTSAKILNKIKLKQDSLRKIDSLKKDSVKKVIVIKVKKLDDLAKTFIANHQLKTARDTLAREQTLMPDDTALTSRIRVLEKLINEDTYDFNKRQGDIARSKRNFKDAIKYYGQAQTYPERNVDLGKELVRIKQIDKEISDAGSFLQTREYDKAINECERLLNKVHKNEKKDYPEFYFIEAEAYLAWAKSKGGDSGYEEKARKNYALAIDSRPDYPEALLAEAEFYVTYKNEYSKPISDYGGLITNTPDTAVKKPSYYIRRAELQVFAKNIVLALTDIQSAIKLNPKTAAYHFSRGELLYNVQTGVVDNHELLNNVQNNSNALTSFTEAIRLNSTYKNAYYYRGLNYMLSNNYDLAGADFASLEKIGFIPYQKQTVDSLSNKFFIKGSDLMETHNYAAADTAFDNALKIRKNNARALHGKADIRFIIATKAVSKSDAESYYKESINLNKQAIAFDSNFSDAYYKEGLAQNNIHQPDSAIQSYTAAIRSYPESIYAFIERGDTYLSQEKYKNAEPDYSKAIALLKKYTQQAKNVKDKELEKQNTLELSKTYKKDGETRYLLNDNDDGAIAALDSAIAKDEKYAEAYYYRGLAYYRKEKGISNAISDFNSAIKISGLPKYYYANAKACLLDGNFDKTFNNLDSLVRLDISNAFEDKNYLLGLNYLNHDKFPEALLDFSKYDAFKVSKNDADFYADFGLAQLYTDQDTAAISHFNAALRLSPRHPKALYRLGCAHAKAGQFKEALDSIEKAFITGSLSKKDIKREESKFLKKLKKDDESDTRYTALKTKYLLN